VKSNYEHKDETGQDPETSFKINFYFSVLDTAVMLRSERSEQLKCTMPMSVFSDIHGLSKKNYDIKLTFCKNLQEKLTDSARKEGDICAMDLIKEKESKLFWNKELLLFRF
jgi:hypothetical protein